MSSKSLKNIGQTKKLNFMIRNFFLNWKNEFENVSVEKWKIDENSRFLVIILK